MAGRVPSVRSWIPGRLHGVGAGPMPAQPAPSQPTPSSARALPRPSTVAHPPQTSRVPVLPRLDRLAPHPWAAHCRSGFWRVPHARAGRHGASRPRITCGSVVQRPGLPGPRAAPTRGVRSGDEINCGPCMMRRTRPWFTCAALPVLTPPALGHCGLRPSTSWGFSWEAPMSPLPLPLPERRPVPRSGFRGQMPPPQALVVPCVGGLG